MPLDPLRKTQMTSQGRVLHKCAACGSMVEKVYQHNFCKECILKSFKKMKPFIDYYREAQK